MVDGLHADVVLAARALGVSVDALRAESQNAGYGGAVAAAGGVVTRFRVGRITPSKPGLFVAA